MTRVGIVVSTLGRVDAVDALLTSLHGEVKPGDRVVVVAQGARGELADVIAAYASRGLDCELTESARGASLGRNTGARLLGDTVDVLHFPNDTSHYPPGTLDAIRASVEATPLAALTAMGGSEPKSVLPEPGTALDLYNAWAIIEMGLIIRASTFAELGGFDEGIGTGAPTPWQAGEATDLVLRALDCLGPQCLTWLPASVTLDGIEEARGLTPHERRRKLRAYNRGLGLVVRRWNYPLPWTVAFVGGGLAWSLRHRGYAPIDGWAVFVGRIEGFRGKTWGRGTTQAVDR